MFSEKFGYKPEIFLFEDISDTLRKRVWNLFYVNEIAGSRIKKPSDSDFAKNLTLESIIMDKLGLEIDCSDYDELIDNKIKTYLVNNAKWYEVYDFIEIHLSVLSTSFKNTRMEQYNTLLEEEKSGYRVIDYMVVPITNETEIVSVNQVLDSQFDSVKMHFDKALKCYSHKKKPDYENSIKESISAVEAMCSIIIGKDGTLNKTITELKQNDIHIHQALEKAFISLYGYACDEKGIRHGGIDYGNVKAEDAKYMLVTCSAFINYLIEKWNKIKDGGNK